MNDLLKKKCVPCEGGAEPLTAGEAHDYMAKVPGWVLSEDGKKISREYKFKDFIGSINFVERVADMAKMEDHHPDIHVYYNKVILELWTHAIGGLSENDFIVAAKVDADK
ncbi:MAG: 4a-hydroxytetrahydrobiopterin dehydratase [Candidatus Zambryskibacteria bacterium]|nr:4a-hydroxytetrahydrobiopterin dehydratase [Candidatus Zambryskibacteria bacterium]